MKNLIRLAVGLFLAPIYMTHAQSSSTQKISMTNAQATTKDPDSIGVIEIRNYLLKEGKRDAFINYFEDNFINAQKEFKGYPLAQYRVKGSEDNFCWVRGFENMKSRSSFLPSFYFSNFWKQHRNTANSMIVNNDNVYLLRPLVLQNDLLIAATGIKTPTLHPNDRIAVVDFYTANHKREQLKKIFATAYLPLIQDCGVSSYSIWESESQENDFPRLPVFQDKNLLVTIVFYKNELAYQETMKLLNSKIDGNLKAELLDAITIKQTMILYPTDKSKNQ